MSLPSVGLSQRLRHNTGITRSLVIMVASAMLAMITMAVAAGQTTEEHQDGESGRSAAPSATTDERVGMVPLAEPGPRPASTTGTTNTVNTAR